MPIARQKSGGTNKAFIGLLVSIVPTTLTSITSMYWFSPRKRRDYQIQQRYNMTHSMIHGGPGRSWPEIEKDLKKFEARRKRETRRSDSGYSDPIHTPGYSSLHVTYSVSSDSGSSSSSSCDSGSSSSSSCSGSD